MSTATRPADPFTRRLLLEAGVQPGMRVLDLGCGTGDVTRLVADLVGDGGHVVGLDRQPMAIDKARELTSQQGLANVRFDVHDLSELLPQLEPFDAVVGRRVLMYVADPGRILTQLRTALRAGGMVISQEVCGGVFSKTPGFTLHDRVNDWIWQASIAEGANPRMGLELAPLLERCGFVVEGVRAEALIEGRTTSLATIAQAIESRILRHCDVTSEALDIASLPARLAEERARASSVYVSNLTVGVYARSP